MRGRLVGTVLIGLACFLLGAGLSTVCHDRKVQQLREYSHQVATSSAAIVARANARADTARRRADSIGTSRRTVLRVVERDTTAAAVAARSLAAARTVRDTNVALRMENQALRGALGSLWVALAQSDTIIAIERARGDSLRQALGDVNLQLQSLNVRVQQLKPPPRLLRYTWEALKLIAVAKVAYDAGRRNR